MSTKTKFKRIALVAVAALTLGSFSTVSASAAPLSNGAILTTVAAVSAPASATPGVAVTGIFSHNGLMNGYNADIVSTSANIVAAPTTSLLAPNAPLASLYTGTAYTNTAGATTIITDNNAWGNSGDFSTVAKTSINTPLTAPATTRITAYFNVTFTPDKAGTYVITVKNQQDSTQLVNWTVTVTDSGVDAVASTAVLGNPLNSGAITAPVAPAIYPSVLTAPKASASGYANIQLTMVRTNATAYTGSDFSAVLSGPGLISASNSTCAAPSLGASKVAAIALGSNGRSCIQISGDGLGGKSTLSILVGTTVWKTFTLNFIDVATQLSVATTTNTATGYGPGTVVEFLGIGLEQHWQLNALDVLKLVADATPDIIITVADATIAASVSDPTDLSNGLVKIKGVKAGTTTFTVQNAAKTFTLGPVTVNVSDVLASSATLLFNKSEYRVGEAFTLTVAAKDAGGNPLADNQYTPMATIATNVQVVAGADNNGNPLVIVNGAITPVFSGGKTVLTGFMPASTGDVVVTLTLNKTGGGLTGVATSAAGAVLKATASVSSLSVEVAQAALDAAAEATDAANAATDAANAAAEAADAATAAAQDAADAVAVLSAQIATMMAQLKAQLTALTNLIIKIQKKLKA